MSKNTEVCAPNIGGHTVDGKPWPEPPKKARKNTEPAPVADVEEE